MTDGPMAMCRKPGCQSAVTRLCAEGHSPLESCPWFGSGTPHHSDNHLSEGAEEDDFVELCSGLPLGVESVDEILRARPVRIVAIVGDRDSGKTTLICSLYENLLRGQFTDWQFCGSRTLVGFEERSHNFRAASHRAAPETPHTSLAEGLRFFHLCISATDAHTGFRTDLVLSDRAGEAFVSVRDKPATGKELIEVVNADRVAILLDGKRIVDPETRGNAMQGVRRLLRALIDGDAVTHLSHVQVLLTKKDLIARAAHGPDLQQRIGVFFQTLSNDFGSKLASLRFLEIAARDPLAETKHGLDLLLNDWLSVEVPHPTKAALTGPRASEFDRLLDRVELDYLP